MTIDTTRLRELANHFNHLEQIMVSPSVILRLLDELEKWRNWKPDDETLADMQAQAKGRDGDYKDSLAANAIYIGGLEYKVKTLDAQLSDAMAAIRAECAKFRFPDEDRSLLFDILRKYEGAKSPGEEDGSL